jgi:acyl-CoA thioester hydrolase
LHPFEREWQREFSYLDATLLTLVLATVRAAGDNAVVMSTRPVIPHRNEFPYFRPMMTRWLDNDAYGHINNVVYYEYFDTTVNAFLIEATGTDTRSLAQIGIVAETGCVFHSSLSFPQPLEIGLAVERLGRSSVTYGLGVFAQDAEWAAATGKFVHVYVDAQSRRPVEIPALIRAVLEPLNRPLVSA